MKKYFMPIRLILFTTLLFAKDGISQSLEIEFLPTGALSTTATADFCKLNQYDLRYQVDWDAWADANLTNNSHTTEVIEKVTVQFQFKDYNQSEEAFYYIVPLQETRENNIWNNINDPYYASEKVPSAYDLYDYLEMGNYRAHVSLTIGRTTNGSYDSYTESITSNIVTLLDGGIDEKGAYYGYKVGNRLVSGDFDNDGYEDDMAAMYHDGGTSTKIHFFEYNSSAKEFEVSQPWHSTAFDGSKVKGYVSGDFDNDGYNDDIVALYDYGDNHYRAHVFRGNGSGLVYAGYWYQSGSGAYGYDLNKVKSRVVSGDFDHDGFEDDIAMMYDYGSSSMRIHTLKSNGSTIQSGGSWYYAASGMFDANKVTGRMVTGDFDNDGYKDDITCFYHYSGSTTKAFIFKSNGSNAFYSPTTAYSSNTFDGSAITNKVVLADYDNDGKKDDLITFYYYGSGLTKAFLFKGNGFGFNNPTSIYNSGIGNFDASLIYGICSIDESNNGILNSPAMIYNMSDFVDVSARGYVFEKYVESSANSLIYPSVRWSACNTGIYNYYKAPETLSNDNMESSNEVHGVSSGMNGFDFKIFPNPTNSSATVIVNDLGYGKTLRIELLDLTGKIISNEILQNQIHEIDFSSFKSGTYLIRVTSDTNSEIKKIQVL